jgi:purine nucleosidase
MIETSLGNAGLHASPKIIVDCDAGIDDAFALLMIAQAQKRGLAHLDCVFSVAGNVDSLQAASNVRFVLETADLGAIEVIQGSDVPLSGFQRPKSSIFFHAADGLGGLAESPAEKPLVSFDPGRELAERIHRCSGSIVLLCLGPLTNIALALQADPGICAKVNRVVIMGGALGAPSGNITPTSEFNFYVDPEAASEVLRSSLPIELVPLDVTERVPFEYCDIGAMSGFPRDLLAASMRLYKAAFNERRTYIHDGIAATVALDPQMSDYIHMNLEIVTEGDDAGHVNLVHPDGPSGSRVRVVSDIDPVRAKTLFHELLDNPGLDLGK